MPEAALLPSFLALLGSVLANLSFVPYFIDIFRGKTRPHAVSWLIWSITQGVGAAGLWYAGATLAAAGVTFATLLALGIFFLSLTHGTKHIDLFDALVLVLAIVAILFWTALQHPAWAIVLVSFIEALGFVPTLRKAWRSPRSESIPSWSLYFFGMALLILSVPEYSILSLTYLATMAGASFLLLFILLLRKR